MATKHPHPSAPSVPHGSSTITIRENQPAEDDAPKVTLVLKRKPKKTVKWDSTAVDNEGMGKKSSKKCCIYSKPREFGESDSESEEEHDCHDHAH